MTIIVLENCPQGLRGDLTKWLTEINSGVYAGNINARIRDLLWERICDNIRSGKATMVWSARGEQGMNFRVHNTSWQPVDYDGITLMMRPLPSSEASVEAGHLRSGFSKAAKARMRQRAEMKRSAEKRQEEADTPTAFSYVVIDTETTGLDCSRDSILEIGALKICGGVPTAEFCSLIRCDENVPDEVAKLTGISNEMLASEGRPIDEVLKELADFIANERIVCHNAKFDIGFIQTAARKCGLSIMHGNKCEDTLAIARRKLRGIKSFKLTDIACHLSLDTSGAHRAMTDCYLTHRIYEKLNKNSNS